MDRSYWIATQSAFGDEPTKVAGTRSLVVPRRWKTLVPGANTLEFMDMWSVRKKYIEMGNFWACIITISPQRMPPKACFTHTHK